MDRVITVSAVVLRNESGALLIVRKVGSSRFMLPGGKPEPGEAPRETAIRECAEETGVRLPARDLTELGTFTAAAANEAGFAVRANVFECRRVVQDATAAAEIAELRCCLSTTRGVHAPRTRRCRWRPCSWSR